jgi:hypothetical protein
MNKPQQTAAVNLIVLGTILLFSLIAISMVRAFGGGQIMSQALGLVGICWLIAVPGFMAISEYFMKRRNRQRVTFDERDRQIYDKAQMAGAGAFGAFLAFVSLYAWLNAGPKGTISVNALPVVTGTGLMIFACVQSVVALVLYARGGEGGN